MSRDSDGRWTTRTHSRVLVAVACCLLGACLLIAAISTGSDSADNSGTDRSASRQALIEDDPFTGTGESRKRKRVPQVDEGRRGTNANEADVPPEMRRKFGRERRAFERRERSPELKEARKRSRVAYRDSSDAEAIEIARESHDIDEPVWEQFDLPAGTEVKAYPSDLTARLDRGGEKSDMLVQSDTPLVAPDDEGVKRPVALDLMDQGDELVPRNPVNDYSISRRIEEGVTIGEDGFGAQPVELTAASKPAIVGDKVFFPNVDTDTDWMIAPMPMGVETFYQLRSQESPEDLAINVDVPEGARIEDDPRGPFKVIKDGELVGIVSKPISYDVDRNVVKTTYRWEGSRLLIHVEHRGNEKLRYPVMMDPVFTDTDMWWGGSFSQGWKPFDTTGGQFWAGIGWDWWGLWGQKTAMNWQAWMHQSQFFRYHYNLGEDRMPDARISWAHLGSIKAQLNGGFCVSAGLMNWAAGWDYGNSSMGQGPGTWCGWNAYGSQFVDTGWAGGASSAGCCAKAAHQIWTPSGPFYGYRQTPNSEIVSVANIAVGIEDNTAPVIAELGAWHSNGWTNATATPTQSMQSYDEGLGVMSQEVLLNGTQVRSNHTCTGNASSSTCPLSSSTFNFTVDLPEGENTIEYRARDVANNTSTALMDGNWARTVWRVDRSSPSVKLSGPLWERRTRLIDEKASMTITATDGKSSQPSERQSGVKKISVAVKGPNDSGFGSEQELVNQPCTAENGS